MHICTSSCNSSWSSLQGLGSALFDRAVEVFRSKPGIWIDRDVSNSAGTRRREQEVECQEQQAKATLKPKSGTVWGYQSRYMHLPTFVRQRIRGIPRRWLASRYSLKPLLISQWMTRRESMTWVDSDSLPIQCWWSFSSYRKLVTSSEVVQGGSSRDLRSRKKRLSCSSESFD